MNALLAVAALAALLSFANGANDVSKGIATLVGSGLSAPRLAVLWGAFWTAAGGAVAFLFAGAMLSTFGRGLLAPAIVPTFAATVAALLGAAAWVLLATRFGLPVSTTHALVGGVVGSAVAAYGPSGVAWSALLTTVALPLAFSPVAAFGLAFALQAAADRRSWGRSASGAGADCLCADMSAPVLVAAPAEAAALRLSTPVHVRLTVAPVDACDRQETQGFRVTSDHLHWASSGAVSFARGLNDAPKIVALGLAAAATLPPGAAVAPAPLFALVTVAMLAGSLLAGRRVTRVLAEDVTPMSHREGLAANIGTAALVGVGAVYGLPMSTTHVSGGGLAGIGLRRGSLNWQTARAIALAWVVTLPASAALAGAAHLVTPVAIAWMVP